jgi:UDP-glucose 4-epimerase
VRVAVIGATGNVGTAVLDLLSGDPEVEEVRGFARRLPQKTWAKTSFSAFDVTRDDLAPHLSGIDAVIHLAWTLHPPRKPAVTWEVNVRGTEAVIDAAVRAGVDNFICASSSGAYSPGRGREVGEDWPTSGHPTCTYGREKAYVERLLDIAEARHPELRVVRMRPGLIFQRSSGSQQRRLFAGPLLPAALLRPGALPVLPFPAGLKLQALHAADAAEAYLLALKSDLRGGFNLAAEPVLDGDALASVLRTRFVPVPVELARAALAAAWLAHLVPVEPAFFDLAYNLPLMRCNRAREELGWVPRVSATDALAEALEGMREGAGGATGPLAPARG